MIRHLKLHSQEAHHREVMASSTRLCRVRRMFMCGQPARGGMCVLPMGFRPAHCTNTTASVPMAS